MPNHNIFGCSHQPNVWQVVEQDRRNNTLKKVYFGFEIETQTYWSRVVQQEGQNGVHFLYPDTNEFFRQTGWAPCSDGSISGVEYKSPLISHDYVFPPDVELHINLSVRDKQCGGHIHLWSPVMDNAKIVDILSKFVWIFSLFYRKDSTYARIGNDYGAKYNWLYQHHRGSTEVRIFRSPRNVKQMRFRMKFLELLIASSPKNFDEAIDFFFDSEAMMKLMKLYVSDKTRRFMRRRVPTQAFRKTTSSFRTHSGEGTLIWGEAQQEHLQRRIEAAFADADTQEHVEGDLNAQEVAEHNNENTAHIINDDGTVTSVAPEPEVEAAAA